MSSTVMAAPLPSPPAFISVRYTVNVAVYRRPSTVAWYGPAGTAARPLAANVQVISRRRSVRGTAAESNVSVPCQVERGSPQAVATSAAFAGYSGKVLREVSRTCHVVLRAGAAAAALVEVPAGTVPAQPDRATTEPAPAVLGE